MTVLAVPNAFMQKSDPNKTPLVDENVCPEAKIHVPSPLPPMARTPPRRAAANLLFHFVNVLLFMMLFLTVALIVYRQCLKINAIHRYQGYCTIPIDIKELQQAQLIEPNYRVMPLRWSSEPDVQVISTVDETTSRDFVNGLREELDIDDMVEKISVLNNGHNVNFIHDFASNITNIVDEERCFTMDLDPELVLAPEVFVLSIESGDEFDVSRVRSTVRALLPALRDMTSLPAICHTRPTYRLRRDDRLVRKRSADAPPHDYIQFAGKHIQEIEIGNLGEILNYEKNA